MRLSDWKLNFLRYIPSSSGFDESVTNTKDPSLDITALLGLLKQTCPEQFGRRLAFSAFVFKGHVMVNKQIIDCLVAGN